MAMATNPTNSFATMGGSLSALPLELRSRKEKQHAGDKIPSARAHKRSTDRHPDRESQVTGSGRARGEAIMRLAGMVFVLALAAGAAHAGPVACPGNALPLEVPGSDQAQIEMLIKQGLACTQAGKRAGAIALFSEAIRRDPTNAVAYLNRGSTQASLGELALAVGDYSTAIGLHPDLVEAWYDRGTTLTHMRRFERAIADLTEALRLKPDFALAFCNRGLANFELGRYDDALVDYSVAIDHDPKLAYCYFGRGNLYLTIGDYQRAISDFTTALGEHASDAVALSRRGQAYEALGQKSQALDDFRAALEADATLESAREGFARLMAERQQSDGGK